MVARPSGLAALRWEVGAVGFALATAAANAVVYNGPLFAFAAGALEVLSVHGLAALGTVALVVFSSTAFCLVLLLMIAPTLAKSICMLGAIANATAVYFVVSYGVILDREIMGNVVGTNFAEAADYVGPWLIVVVAALGGLPCWVLSRVRVRPPRRRNLLACAFALAVGTCVWAYAASTTWLWFDHYGKRLGGLVVPWSYVVNAVRYQSSKTTAAASWRLLPAGSFVGDGRTAVVLVIGEAARAGSFSLYGYARRTNPSLEASGAVALRGTDACATYTTASLRCIVHVLDGDTRLEDHEPLPDYLERHGVDVVWRSNNWGEPPLRVRNYVRAGDLRGGCRGDGCAHDDVLLTGLEERIRSSPATRTFVVLHQRGSHGPSYHDEVPAGFAGFEPVCESVNLGRCSRESLVNAYDNTILYTDRFLGEAIRILRGLAGIPAVLIYVSDHGQSLGEGGLYLHGTPFAIAPPEQTRVPFIVWMSPGFAEREGVVAETMTARDSHGQENVFHSVMGALGMRSEFYDPRLDVFRAGGRNGSVGVGSSVGPSGLAAREPEVSGEIRPRGL